MEQPESRNPTTSDDAVKDQLPESVLAACEHMTEPVFVDGLWRTPQLCDDCIIENASRPLTAEQTQDFARVSEQLLDRLKGGADEQPNDRL